MSALNRFRAWWLGQYRSQRGLGKAIWLGAPLLFTCCFCWAALLVVVPSPDVEPTAELAERAGATVVAEATQEPVELTAALTDEPVVQASLTTAPSRTAVPRPTTAATTEMSATAMPSATPQPTETAVPPTATATQPPTTATSVPPTATGAPLPTATSVPPTLAPTQAPPTAVPPTAVPPTAIPPTPVPPTAALPTAVPQPTATLPTAAGQLVITNVNKREEFVDIQNTGGTEVVLDGWVLRREGVAGLPGEWGAGAGAVAAHLGDVGGRGPGWVQLPIWQGNLE